jgi:predicted PurR-regulated permease PerM
MNSNTITNGILKAIAVIAGVFLLLYFLYEIQSVIAYIAISVVIALIGSPIIHFLKRRLKFPNFVAVLTTMLLFLGILAGVISMFIPLIIKQGENLSLLNIEQLQMNIEQLLNQVNDYFFLHNIDILNELKNADLFKNLKAIPDLLNAIIGTIGSFSVGLFSVIFITFFLMKDSHLLENSLYALVNDKSEPKLRDALASINHLLSRYFIGLVLQILILFIMYLIILAIFGIENAIVIAFLCALLNLIPYIGPLFGGVLLLILTMSNNLGQDFQSEILPTTIYVMIGYMVAQFIDNNVSVPFIFSKSVKSHPLEIFLVIIIGGILFGITGMIVAVPMYTAVKVILKAFLPANKIVKLMTKDL